MQGYENAGLYVIDSENFDSTKTAGWSQPLQTVLINNYSINEELYVKVLEKTQIKKLKINSNFLYKIIVQS